MRAAPGRERRPHVASGYGAMFWFSRNRFVGS
jgi:hypothetical protein